MSSSLSHSLSLLQPKHAKAVADIKAQYVSSPCQHNDGHYHMFLIGPPQVGKSCLFLSYTTNVFPAKDTCPTTCESGAFSKMIDQHPFTMHLHDTRPMVEKQANSSRDDVFAPIVHSIAGVEMGVCVFMFDVCRQSTLFALEPYIRQVRDQSPNSTCLLCGNKSDLWIPPTEVSTVTDVDGIATLVRTLRGSEEVSKFPLSVESVDIVLDYLRLPEQGVTKADITAMCNKFDMSACVVSALTQEGLRDALDLGVRLNRSERNAKTKQLSCQIS